MSTASSASRLLLSSQNSKTLSFCKPNKPGLISLVSPSFSSLKPHAKPISVSVSIFLSLGAVQQPLSSRLVRNVAISSEFGREEDVSSDGDKPSISAKLTLFVGNLCRSVDNTQLASLFEEVGNVKKAKIIYDYISGKSKGYGFVTMTTVDEFEAAVQRFNGYKLEGRALRVNSAFDRQRETPFSRVPRGDDSFSFENRVCVTNLSRSVDDVALENLFSEQGKVLATKVIYDKETGVSRGFGFVTYGSTKEAEGAVKSLNGVEFKGRPIHVSIAEPKARSRTL